MMTECAATRALTVIRPSEGEQSMRIGYAAQQTAHHFLALRQVEHLDLCTDQIDMRRDNVQPLHGSRLHSFGHRQIAHETFVYGVLQGGDVHAQSGGSIGLRIGVDHQYFLLQGSERSCQIDSRCSLAYTAFLIGQSDYFTHISRISMRQNYVFSIY